MMTVIYLLKILLWAVLSVLELFMFGRAILSWFDQMMDWRITRFLYFVTEPIIAPVRMLLQKMNWFQNTPVDVAFILTWLILSILEYIIL